MSQLLIEIQDFKYAQYAYTQYVADEQFSSMLYVLESTIACMVMIKKLNDVVT